MNENGSDGQAVEAYDVFVSHSSADAALAMEFVDTLESMGLRCWIAPRDIAPGSEYGSEIIRGLRQSKHLVMLLSEESRQSRHVRAEVERAVNLRHPVYCVRLADIDLGDELEFFLSMVQSVDAFGPDRYPVWTRLAQAIARAPVAKRSSDDAAKSVVRARVTQTAKAYQNWPARLLRVVAYALIGWVLLMFDPLGVSYATNKASERVFFNIMAPFYGEAEVPLLPEARREPGALPVPGDEPADKWNDDITVLLLADDALEFMGRAWPVSFDVHGDIIRDVYETYAPNAIMIDLIFGDRREGEAEALARFVALLSRINDEGRTRIYIAAYNMPPNDPQILAELRKIDRLVAISWHEPRADGGDFLYYPLARGAGERQSVPMGLEVGDPGAAYVIYRDLCETAGAQGAAAMHCPDTQTFGRHFELPMAIFWGVDGPSLNWEQSNRGSRFNCRSVSGSLLGRTFAFVKSGILGGSTEFPQDCPYTQMIQVRDFVDPTFRAYPDVIKAYGKALGGGTPDAPKVVFYGADLRGVEDRVDTYTHGRVAGVYAHAMALDNLMTLGGEYIRYAEEENVQRGLDLVVVLIVAALSVLLTDIRFLMLQRATSRDDRLSGFIRSPFGAAALLALNLFVVTPVALGSAGIAFFVFHLSPANWVAYLGIAGVIRLAESRAVEKAALAVLSVRKRS